MSRYQAASDDESRANNLMESMAQDLLDQINRPPRQSRSMQASASAILDNLRGNRDRGEDLTDTTRMAMQAACVYATKDGGLSKQLEDALHAARNAARSAPEEFANQLIRSYHQGILTLAEVDNIFNNLGGDAHPSIVVAYNYIHRVERERLLDAQYSRMRDVERNLMQQRMYREAVGNLGLTVQEASEITNLNLTNPAALLPLPVDYADGMETILPTPPAPETEVKMTPTKSLEAISKTRKRKILKLKR